MKKIYLFPLVLFSSATFLNAQSSIHLTKNSDGATISNGGNIYQSTLANVDNVNDLDIKNISSLYNTYKVKKFELALNTSAQSYFCTGINCYSPSQVNSNPFDLDVNSTVALRLYLTEGPTSGQSSIRYLIYNANDATDTLSFTISYNNPLGVQNIAKQLLNISNVFPNPCAAKAQITFTSATELLNTTVTIINSLGIIVSKKDVDVAEGRNNISLDIEHLSTGIYFVSIPVNNSKIVKKFTVNK